MNVLDRNKVQVRIDKEGVKEYAIEFTNNSDTEIALMKAEDWMKNKWGIYGAEMVTDTQLNIICNSECRIDFIRELGFREVW